MSPKRVPDCRVFLGIFVTALTLVGCGAEPKRDDHPPLRMTWSPLARLIADEDKAIERRLEAMEGLTPPQPTDVVEALLLTMKDKSQQAFITVPDESDLGYHVQESPFGGTDERAALRWTAVMALERLGVKAALPDLISALNDRHPVVGNHAARALWSLGSAAGLPVLVTHLGGKAFANETANRILEEITGKDAGFDTDAGGMAKLAAIENWKSIVGAMPAPARTLPSIGDDAHLDARMRFLVAVLGQHQFLFMEQARGVLGSLGDLATDHIDRVLQSDSLGSNQTLRAYAVQSLERIATPKARMVLRRLLGDEDASVRARSAKALGTLKDSEARASLGALLEDDDESVVAAAASALGIVGDDSSKAALIRARSGPSRDARLQLIVDAALARLGDQPAGARVVEAMQSGSIDQRIDLARILETWEGGLMGYDPDLSGSEQESVLAAWRQRLTGN
ncbi:MAG: HEAT repeat domain-containing protein [Planctomycetes bacterium]|nr:HEAT repeat domain-containing protein [Planctomycetota bacterium]